MIQIGPKWTWSSRRSACRCEESDRAGYVWVSAFGWWQYASWPLGRTCDCLASFGTHERAGDR
eukprot:5016705-Alexandrium_andersonii.AAC.1